MPRLGGLPCATRQRARSFRQADRGNQGVAGDALEKRTTASRWSISGGRGSSGGGCDLRIAKTAIQISGGTERTFAMTASVGPSPEPNAKPVRTAGNSVRPSLETNCSESDGRGTRQGLSQRSKPEHSWKTQPRNPSTSRYWGSNVSLAADSQYSRFRESRLACRTNQRPQAISSNRLVSLSNSPPGRVSSGVMADASAPGVPLAAVARWREALGHGLCRARVGSRTTCSLESQNTHHGPKLHAYPARATSLATVTARFIF